MIQMIIMATAQHTNLLFRVVEILADSPIWLGLCGAGLTIAPIMGIMIIHKDQPRNEKD